FSFMEYSEELIDKYDAETVVAILLKLFQGDAMDPETYTILQQTTHQSDRSDRTRTRRKKSSSRRKSRNKRNKSKSDIADFGKKGSGRKRGSGKQRKKKARRKESVVL